MFKLREGNKVKLDKLKHATSRPIGLNVIETMRVEKIKIKYFDALLEVAEDADWYCKWDGAEQRNDLRKALKALEALGEIGEIG